MNDRSTARTPVPDLSPEAIERWRKSIRDDAFSNYHHKMGVALAKQKETAAAVAAFQRALAVDPSHFGSAHHLAALLRAAGQADAADTVLNNAKSLDPDAEALGHADIAEDLLEEGQSDEAAMALRTAIAGTPRAARRAVESLNFLGQVRMNEKRYAEALEAFDLAAPHMGEDAGFQIERGNALMWLNRLDEAVSAFRIAVEQRPDWWKARYYLGLGLLYSLAFDEAAQNFGISQCEEPRASTVLLLARSVELAGRPDESVHILTDALNSSPSSPAMLAQRGFCRMRLGQTAEALADVNGAVTGGSDPALRSLALSHRAMVQLALGNLAGADADATEALRHPPQLALTGVILAAVRLGQGRPAEGKVALTQAAALAPHQVALGLRLIQPFVQGIDRLAGLPEG
ncbi:tetratricopeptide repeat protein [Azospirillum sp. SYSU D00513]|uniref:tetratricopeptide repeat protein n=1 Tax=Azospirillum sp. SYSU D00513 TaxID=2812561 RepID=UPI001A96F332|nr:tetratricopeptide repeat protein [Azospirillum sp. SYSU D00513]